MGSRKEIVAFPWSDHDMILSTFTVQNKIENNGHWHFNTTIFWGEQLSKRSYETNGLIGKSINRPTEVSLSGGTGGKLNIKISVSVHAAINFTNQVRT